MVLTCGTKQACTIIMMVKNGKNTIKMMVNACAFILF